MFTITWTSRKAGLRRRWPQQNPPICGLLIRQMFMQHLAVPNTAQGDWGFSRSKLKSLPSWSSHSWGLQTTSEII